jgi:DNA-binding response OmpR family regulator
MSFLILLADRGPEEALPALFEVPGDVKHEPLSVAAAVHAIGLHPAAVVVDASEDPGRAWAVLEAIRDAEGPNRGHSPVVVILERHLLGARPWHEAADAFLSPGASAAELDLRLAMVRRRGGGDGDGGAVVRLGPLSLDVDTFRVALDGRPLDLTYKEFELLRFLASSPGRVFTRPTLLREVWGYDFYGGTRTVDVHVRRLRAKLGPEGEALIETVRGVGYRASDGRGPD